MGKHAVAACLMLLLAVSVATQAQTVPKAEVFGGYTYVRANLITPNGCCFNMNGGLGSVSFNLKSTVGLVGEFGVYHSGNVLSSGLDLTFETFLFGPRFSYRRSKRMTLFGQVLLGGGHAGGSLYNAPGLSPNSGFALATGGGFDLNVSEHVAIRIFEADYLLTKFQNGINQRQNNLRLAFGVTFKAGKR